MVNIIFRATLLVCIVFVASCGTTDSTIRDQGHSEAYLQGFHDGRHSGMKEAGNTWEHYVRDHERFAGDGEYRDGWLAGEVEGKHLQEQAKTMGDAMAGTYTASKTPSMHLECSQEVLCVHAALSSSKPRMHNSLDAYSKPHRHALVHMFLPHPPGHF